MAKGQYSKQIIIEKILEEFDGAFDCGDGKELRIPMTEDGAEVQIKVALTCAKEMYLMVKIAELQALRRLIPRSLQ